MLDIDKEIKIRSRIEYIFNNLQEDFPSQLEWDDYLEEREEIIFDLVEGGKNAAGAEAKISAYQKSHADQIARNQARALSGRMQVQGTVGSQGDLAGAAAAAAGVAVGADVGGAYVPEGLAFPGGSVLPAGAGGGGGEDAVGDLDPKTKAVIKEWGKKRALDEALSSMFLF